MILFKYLSTLKGLVDQFALTTGKQNVELYIQPYCEKYILSTLVGLTAYGKKCRLLKSNHSNLRWKHFVSLKVQQQFLYTVFQILNIDTLL